jgi:hypothetical protein
MGETAHEIIGDIERARAWLGADLDRLEDKVRREADWRLQYARHRLAFLGVALGAAVLIAVAAVWAGRRTLRVRRRFMAAPRSNR